MTKNGRIADIDGATEAIRTLGIVKSEDASISIRRRRDRGGIAFSSGASESRSAPVVERGVDTSASSTSIISAGKAIIACEGISGMGTSSK